MVAKFHTDGDFLTRIEDALDILKYDHPERVTTIGSGAISLATRLIVQRQDDSCVYAHEWHRSDPDDLHDHPWDWVSIIIAVGYWETSELADGTRIREWRAPGSIKFRRAEERHRVEIDPSKPPRPLSLFITSVEKREWGFWIDDKFIVGREYRNSRTHGLDPGAGIAQGCLPKGSFDHKYVAGVCVDCGHKEFGF